MAKSRPKLTISYDGRSWVVKVDGDPRQWSKTEAEASAFIYGFDNCYDNFVLSERT